MEVPVRVVNLLTCLFLLVVPGLMAGETDEVVILKAHIERRTLESAPAPEAS